MKVDNVVENDLRLRSVLDPILAAGQYFRGDLGNVDPTLKVYFDHVTDSLVLLGASLAGVDESVALTKDYQELNLQLEELRSRITDSKGSVDLAVCKQMVRVGHELIKKKNLLKKVFEELPEFGITVRKHPIDNIIVFEEVLNVIEAFNTILKKMSPRPEDWIQRLHTTSMLLFNAYATVVEIGKDELLGREQLIRLQEKMTRLGCEKRTMHVLADTMKQSEANNEDLTCEKFLDKFFDARLDELKNCEAFQDIVPSQRKREHFSSFIPYYTSKFSDARVVTDQLDLRFAVELFLKVKDTDSAVDVILGVMQAHIKKHHFNKRSEYVNNLFLTEPLSEFLQVCGNNDSPDFTSADFTLKRKRSVNEVEATAFADMLAKVADEFTRNKADRRSSLGNVSELSDFLKSAALEIKSIMLNRIAGSLSKTAIQAKEKILELEKKIHENMVLVAAIGSTGDKMADLLQQQKSLYDSAKEISKQQVLYANFASRDVENVTAAMVKHFVESEVPLANKKVEELQAMLDVQDKKLFQHREKVKALISDKFAKLKSLSTEVNHPELEEMFAALDKLDEPVINVSTLINRLTSEIENLLRNEVLRQQNTIRDLGIEKEVATERLAKVEEEYHRLEADRLELERSRDKIMKQLEQQKIELGGVNAALTSEKELNQNLLHDQEYLKRSNESLSEDLRKNKALLDDKEQQMADLRREKDSAENFNMDSLGSIQSLRDDLAILQEANSEMTRALDESQKLIEQQKNELLELKKAVKKIDPKLIAMLDDVHDLNDIVTRAQAALVAIVDFKQKMINQISEYTKKANDGSLAMFGQYHSTVGRVRALILLQKINASENDVKSLEFIASAIETMCLDNYDKMFNKPRGKSNSLISYIFEGIRESLSDPKTVDLGKVLCNQLGLKPEVFTLKGNKTFLDESSNELRTVLFEKIKEYALQQKTETPEVKQDKGVA